jgi:hypothetical protein
MCAASGAGWQLGVAFGLVLWGSLAMGLYSISTAGLPLLAAWWLGQAVESGPMRLERMR